MVGTCRRQVIGSFSFLNCNRLVGECIRPEPANNLLHLQGAGTHLEGSESLEDLDSSNRFHLHILPSLLECERARLRCEFQCNSSMEPN